MDDYEAITDYVDRARDDAEEADKEELQRLELIHLDGHPTALAEEVPNAQTSILRR
jgi:hypothetical protein